MVTCGEYFKHSLQFKDGRFREPRFVFFRYNAIARMQVLQLGSAYVTRKLGEAHFTIGDLCAAFEMRNTAVTRKILHFGHSLRGSLQYWFATKCNLSAMITQLEKCQLFVTLTLAPSNSTQFSTSL